MGSIARRERVRTSDGKVFDSRQAAERHAERERLNTSFDALAPKWQARWRDPSGKQRKRAFATKREAEAFLVRVEAAKLTGSYEVESSGDGVRKTKPTVDQILWCWWEHHQNHCQPGTRRSYEKRIKTLLRPFFGTMTDVRPMDVQRFFDETPLSRSSLNEAKTILNQAYRAAVGAGAVDTNPVSEVRIPRYLADGQRRPKRHEEVFVPPHSEVAALADWMGHHYQTESVSRRMNVVAATDKLLVRFLALEGFRFSEATFLRGEHVGPMIRIRGTRSTVDGVERPHELKNQSSKRDIPIVASLRAELSDRLAVIDAKQHLFQDPDGGGVDYQRFYAVWKRARRELGFGWSPHALRHHCASTLIDNGLSPSEVAAWLGHRQITTTMNTYVHLFPRTLEAHADRL